MTEDAQNTEQEKTGFSAVMDSFVTHQRQAMEESCKAMESLLPPDFREHSAAARDEFRKSLKVVVDYAIDELEKLTKEDAPAAPSTESDNDEPPSTTGRTKVKVLVD